MKYCKTQTGPNEDKDTEDDLPVTIGIDPRKVKQFVHSKNVPPYLETSLLV